MLAILADGSLQILVSQLANTSTLAWFVTLDIRYITKVWTRLILHKKKKLKFLSILFCWKMGNPLAPLVSITYTNAAMTLTHICLCFNPSSSSVGLYAWALPIFSCLWKLSVMWKMFDFKKLLNIKSNFMKFWRPP